MRSSRLRARAVRALLVGSLVPLGIVPAARAEVVGSLDPGEAVFWNGPFVETSGPASSGSAPSTGAVGSARCDVTIECFSYDLEVSAGGARLRVAVDHPDLFDVFALELRDPGGNVAASGDGLVLGVLPPAAVSGAQYSEEVFVADPGAGTWTVVVLAEDVVASGFRMRAKLESAQAPGEVRDLYPNLRAIPPFQIAFGPCSEDESASRCLRFSQGPANAGDGPLDLFVQRGDLGEPAENDQGQTTLRGTFHQRVQRSDGTTFELEAGEFEYHIEHGHYHHRGTGGYELYRVVGDDLVLAGVSPKQGFCMGDYALVSWESFDAEPPRTDLDYLGGETCAVPTPGATRMGLTSGWGDVYGYFIFGNYIDFGSNPNGEYVIRAETDAARTINESDASDNVSYAHIRVTGGDLDVLERGRGTGPFDPSRVVVADGRQPALTDPKCVPGGECP